jgi:hypothetical protein
MSEHTFDDTADLEELRGRSTEWLRARRVELVEVQRQLRVEELALILVLDELAALEGSDKCHRGVRE